MSAAVPTTPAEPVLAVHHSPALASLRRSLGYGRMQLGLVLALLVAGAALIGPVFAPNGPADLVGAPYSPPSGALPLGADYLGHDVLSRVLWGGRSVLWMSLSATALGVVLGILLGLMAGYSRNFVDTLIMRTLDIVLAFPYIVLVLLFVSLLGSQLWLIVLLVGIAWAPGVARVTRGVTLETATKEFVEVAEVLGLPRWRILLREILPNLATPLMVETGLRLTYSISLIAGISFLGFGIHPPNADWGLMINENRNGLTIQPWGAVAPICCIAVFTIGTNLISEGIARTIAGIDRKVTPR